mmetsp:Transcript_1158/g.3813  ORF Transcript_1158/g.3813 Transcript_1158/m.3813 type:complete len:268 (-) Transcript_1158:1184-1987(-)
MARLRSCARPTTTCWRVSTRWSVRTSRRPSACVTSAPATPGPRTRCRRRCSAAPRSRTTRRASRALLAQPSRARPRPRWTAPRRACGGLRGPRSRSRSRSGRDTARASGRSPRRGSTRPRTGSSSRHPRPPGFSSRSSSSSSRRSLSREARGVGARRHAVLALALPGTRRRARPGRGARGRARIPRVGWPGCRGGLARRPCPPRRARQVGGDRGGDGPEIRGARSRTGDVVRLPEAQAHGQQLRGRAQEALRPHQAGRAPRHQCGEA